MFCRYYANFLHSFLGYYLHLQGINGALPHNPDDKITKVTAFSPGDKGKALWLEALDSFFCGDAELIDYVQQMMGLSILGKVFIEALIIAYGEGSNGKSTFGNAVLKVLGGYGGIISADALTDSRLQAQCQAGAGRGKG